MSLPAWSCPPNSTASLFILQVLPPYYLLCSAADAQLLGSDDPAALRNPTSHVVFLTPAASVPCLWVTKASSSRNNLGENGTASAIICTLCTRCTLSRLFRQHLAFYFQEHGSTFFLTQYFFFLFNTVQSLMLTYTHIHLTLWMHARTHTISLSAPPIYWASTTSYFRHIYAKSRNCICVRQNIVQQLASVVQKAGAMLLAHRSPRACDCQLSRRTNYTHVSQSGGVPPI